jgi:rsbT co-antagonist protein RsbR
MSGNGGTDKAMEDAGLMRRIANFIRLKLIVNIGLILLAVLSYLSRPGTFFLLALLVLIADTAFIWPYWLLARWGHGRMATYASLALSAVSLAAGIHLAGGFGTALDAIYVLLVLAGGLVTESEEGFVIVAVFSTLVYLFVIGIEHSIVLFPVDVLPTIPLALTAVGGMLISIWGTAFISQVFLRTVKAATVNLRHIAAVERERAAENARLLAEREEALAQQSRLSKMVHELSAPIVPLMEKVIAFPLVGHIDKERARYVMDNLLDEVARRQPRVVLLDVTGMTSANQVAVNCLAQMAQGVRLLGAEVVLVGIRAALAETMVDLGLDATQVTIRRDMQSGIAHVLAQADWARAVT